MRALPLLLLVGVAWADPPPPAPVHAVTATYQGISVSDPYRYMENATDPDLLQWLPAQGDYTRKQLDRIPALAPLRARVEALDATLKVRISSPHRSRDGRIFYLKRLGDEPRPKLYVRNGLDGQERLLFDPDESKPAQAINRYSVSPDGKWLALLTAPADSEVGALRVRELATGKDVGAPITGIWGELGASWRADSSGFFYDRSAPPNQAVDDKTLFGKQRVFLHRLAGGEDRQVFGWGMEPKTSDTDWIFVSESEGSPYALAATSRGVNSPARWFVADKRTLSGWRLVVDEKDGARDATFAGQYLYIKTFASAPRFRILRYDLSSPSAPPVEVVAQSSGVIDGLAAASDGLYYLVRNNALTELYLHDGFSAKKLPLPFAGSIDLADANPDLPGVLFMLYAWTRELQMFSASQKAGVANTRLIPEVKGAGELAAEETTCDGWDGAKVPMSIVGAKGFARDGAHPLLVYGYGGYGYTETAFLDPINRAWYELGGLVAYVNPRGSGAYGEEWYRAGQGPKKSNTWKDMIACAEALVARKYTSSSKMGIEGVSMGGVAVGRAVTERPDLFAVALMRVGILDSIRFIEATSNGPNHELEMGSLKTLDGVKTLLEMSAYQHVKDGTRYPAVMVIQGLNDHRVAPWISFKMAARLQAATRSGRPVLLRTDAQGGHGMTTTAKQRDAEWADWIAFHLWQIGRPDFQPR
jgi:prolyl oligopeptidase